MTGGISLTLSMAIIAIASNSALLMAQNADPAPPCPTDPDSCKLPDCRCSGFDIPGDLPVESTPQLVFLTFDNFVSMDNFRLYKEQLFKDRKNPNGHPITATFFITHEYTNYSMVHELWRDGHDISLHSITDSSDWWSYWAVLNESMWYKEIVEQRELVSHFAKIPESDIRGMRAPSLIGGDNMYNVLNNAGFDWECSRPTSYRTPGLWPYTNDFASTQDCVFEPCAIGAYPGFWTVPMIEMTGDNGEGCPMVDICTPVPDTVDDTFELLYRNFQDHYTGNRAPLGVYMHSGWLNMPWPPMMARLVGLNKFLDYLATLNDTYIVGISRAVEWIRSPTPLDDLAEFEPFHVEVKPNSCTESYTCLYPPESTPIGEERYLHSCVPCPRTYPWLGNHLGNNLPTPVV